MRAVEISAVEDLARLARELYAVQDERSQLQLLIDLAVRLMCRCLDSVRSRETVISQDLGRSHTWGRSPSARTAS